MNKKEIEGVEKDVKKVEKFVMDRITELGPADAGKHLKINKGTLSRIINGGRPLKAETALLWGKKLTGVAVNAKKGR